MADLQLDFIDYQLCVIDSGTPDEAARAELVLEQINVEVVDCLTNSVDVLFCNPDANLISLITLITNCTPAAPEE